MAIRVEQSEIVEPVGAAFDSPHDVVRVPVGSSAQLSVEVSQPFS